jgi:hypothetical protein
VGSIESAGGFLWVSLMIPGKKAKAAAKVPLKLSKAFKAATKLLNPNTNESANLGKNADEGNTYFDFAQIIDAEFDGHSENILKWFNSVIISAREFGKGLCD